jgi:hypothetical protein
MDWLTVAATDGDHRYTLSRGLTLVAVGGAALCVLVAAVHWRRRAKEVAPRGCGSLVVAWLAMAATVVAASSGGRDVTVSGLFFGTFALDVAAVLVAGLAAVAVALRARSPAALVKLLPAWLLAQCGLVHARELHGPLPRFSTSLPVPTVQVGRDVYVFPELNHPDIYLVDEVFLSPRARGEHEVIARASGDTIRVERTLRYDAVEERGDPSLPLRPGNHWLLRSADGRAELLVSVGEPRVLDGLRWYEVEVRAEGRDDKGDKISTGRRHRVYEADGRIVDRNGKLLVEGGDTLPGALGRPCMIEGELTCECAEAGPVRCHWRHVQHEGPVEAFLALMTTDWSRVLSLGTADTSAPESKIKTVEVDLALVPPDPSRAQPDR